MPVLVATIRPKEGQLEAVETILREIIPAVHEENGCQLYALHRGQDRLVFVEKWADGETLAAHGGGENMKALISKLAGLVDGAPDVVVLEAVPTGDPGKGAV